MTPEIARAALQFLSRVQLSGSEVPAYAAVHNALNDLAAGAPEPPPAAPPLPPEPEPAKEPERGSKRSKAT